LGLSSGGGGLLLVWIRRGAGRDQGWGLGLGGRHKRRFLGALASKGRRQGDGENDRQIRMRRKSHIFKNLPLPLPDATQRSCTIVMVLSQNSLGQRHGRHLDSITLGIGWRCYPSLAEYSKWVKGAGREASAVCRDAGNLPEKGLEVTSLSSFRNHRKEI